ncbi:MAG: hypothetical protein SFV54_25010 [Bryobacteraceae bacterium]|nr:hypothetical protein [Bryobacteraceae bacterium]
MALIDTLNDFAREFKMDLAQTDQHFELLWSANQEERYIRIIREHYLMQAGVRREDKYYNATCLSFLGANNDPIGNLDYHRRKANTYRP